MKQDEIKTTVELLRDFHQKASLDDKDEVKLRTQKIEETLGQFEFIDHSCEFRVREALEEYLAAKKGDTSSLVLEICQNIVVPGASFIGPITDWNEKPAAREWVIPGMLPSGRFALLVGRGGSGKSRSLSDLALQIV